MSQPEIPLPLDVQDSIYGYLPTEWICILFVTLFALSTLLHIFQSLRFRLWWLLPTVCLAGVGEIIGWSGRLWSSQNLFLTTPFQIQIATTIIAPTPLVAANFVIIEQIILRIGPQYSRLKPKWYAIIFCTCDVIALVIQAVGGGSAASAAGTSSDATIGGNIMLGGIVFQLVSISVYIVISLEFFLRFLKDRPVGWRNTSSQTTLLGESHRDRFNSLDSRLRYMTYALAFNTLCLFIRSVYRTIELADGWNGRIISTQVYFNVLDGMMVVLAIITFNVVHPGRMLFPVPKASDDVTLSKA